MQSRSGVRAAAAAALLGLLVAFLVDRLAPAPAADVARGSEEAFASGLQLREFGGPQRSPSRWTTGRARFLFTNLPPGPRVLVVACTGHRSPVAVVVEGVIVATLGPGESIREVLLPASPKRQLGVVLEVEPFVAGDRRRLGTSLGRVSLRTHPSGAPAPALLAGFAGLAAVGALAASSAGFAALVSSGVGLGLAIVNGVLLWPEGLVRSPYGTTLPVLLGAGALAALGFARWRERRSAGAGRWAFGAALAALVVQGVLASAPHMVVSDAVFHANKLRAVAGGNLFPVSETQHQRPFRFPYGFAFYAALAPGLWARAEAVDLVRWGAAAAGVVGSLALFVMAEPTAPALAGASTILLQLLPGSFDIYSFGNLSNVFGQAAEVLFLAWWLRPRRGAAAGALLLTVAGLSHLSSLFVAAAVGAALLLVHRRRAGRAQRLALAAAALVCGAYYAQFLPLLLEQLPRLREGGGPGDSRMEPLSVLVHQAQVVHMQWGLPAITLAAAGLAASLRGELGRVLLAAWAGGAALFALALVSPLEVRFVYALAPALAVAAARGAQQLAAAGVPARLAAFALLAGQLVLAVANFVEAIVHRYRL